MENENQNPKQQLIARLKESNNVLVTVSRNPSVDQLSAAIGLTLLLNHLGKHATAVFSGQVPNTLEFLKPEETLEKNTDSLRDFIISLDKAKADKLRYKVEDTMVKIFITPYRTSLSDADLVFGQGDFNVDVVVAIGVVEKEDLDVAITSHGRILHDATVATLNTATSGQLGSINWIDNKASSLSEMLVPVCEALKADAMDAQMATAFLTGIVAETERFSNEKTSSDTMNISAKLMAAGANQQLVATKLEQPAPISEDVAGEIPKENSSEDSGAEGSVSDGSLAINHSTDEEPPQELAVEENSELPEIQPEGEAEPEPPKNEEQISDVPDKDSRLVMQPPSLGGTLTANSKPEALDPSTDPLTVSAVDAPLLTHDKPDEPKAEPIITEDEPFDPFKQDPALATPLAPEVPGSQPEAAEETPPPAPEVSEPLPPAKEETPPAVVDEQTLTELESAVESPHIAENSGEVDQEAKTTSSVDAALAAAHSALDAAGGVLPEKPAAFNSTGLMEVNQEETKAEPTAATDSSEATPEVAVDVVIDPATGTLTYPTNLVPPSEGLPTDPGSSSVQDPTAPPTVPPPMAMPPLMPPVKPPDDTTLPPPSQ